MQQDSLSVEDLTFGFSDLLNDNLEQNTQENRGKQQREEDLGDLFSKRDGIGLTTGQCPYDTKHIDCESSNLPSKCYVSPKSAMRKAQLLADMNEDKEPDEASGTRKENSGRTELKLSPKESTFMRRFSAGRTNKSHQYCVGKQEECNSKGICPKETVAGQDLTDGEKKHLWENTKRNKVVKTEPDTRQLKIMQAQSELFPKKLLSVDQIITNPGSSSQRSLSQPRRFSAPFSFRPLSPRGCDYKRISTQGEIDQGNEKIYPDRSKLFSPTPPRKEQSKPNLNELKFTSLTCTSTLGQNSNDSKGSSQKSERRQNVLTALPISLCHKVFEPARVEYRLVQPPDRRETRRRSYEATSSDFVKNFGDTKTQHVSRIPPARAGHNANLLVPLLSGRRKSDSSVHHFTGFDSPIFDSDIDEKLTPLNLSPRATKKEHSVNLSIR